MSFKTYEVKVYTDGTKMWYLNNERHREDGPAIEHTDGSKKWFINDKLHREDGPAVEEANGTNVWYLNGQLHREDGPAVEYPNKTKYWYLNGEHITEAEFDKKMNQSSYHDKTVEIDEKKYILKEIK
jgi:hypothetical protein